MCVGLVFTPSQSLLHLRISPCPGSFIVEQVVDIAKRHGLESVDQQVGQLLSRALETHLGGLIRQVFAMARQRTDTDRMRPGMVLTGNLRKRLHEINARERDRQKAQEAEAADQQQVAISFSTAMTEVLRN